MLLMILKNDHQKTGYKRAAALSTEILRALYEATRVGVTSLQIDALADRLCRAKGARPNFKGVGPADNLYKHATCISVNDTVVHGIPTAAPLRKGDLVKVDFGLEYQGYHTDHCFTLGLEPLSKTDRALLEVGREAVLKGVAQVVAGNFTGDVGHAIEAHVKRHNFTVAHEYIGHGIGTRLHEAPELPAWGERGTGALLKDGMVICVEAQVIAGRNALFTAPDGWSVKTEDGSKAVMFEYMILVGREAAHMLTPTADWALTV
jgi:methionyl aminopeptidase